jgi:hypothetical protein
MVCPPRRRFAGGRLVNTADAAEKGGVDGVGDAAEAWPLNRIGIRTWSKPRRAMNGKSSA